MLHLGSPPQCFAIQSLRCWASPICCWNLKMQGKLVWESRSTKWPRMMQVLPTWLSKVLWPMFWTRWNLIERRKPRRWDLFSAYISSLALVAASRSIRISYWYFSQIMALGFENEIVNSHNNAAIKTTQCDSPCCGGVSGDIWCPVPIEQASLEQELIHLMANEAWYFLIPMFPNVRHLLCPV